MYEENDHDSIARKSYNHDILSDDIFTITW